MTGAAATISALCTVAASRAQSCSVVAEHACRPRRCRAQWRHGAAATRQLEAMSGRGSRSREGGVEQVDEPRMVVLRWVVAGRRGTDPRRAREDTDERVSGRGAARVTVPAA